VTIPAATYIVAPVAVAVVAVVKVIADAVLRHQAMAARNHGELQGQEIEDRLRRLEAAVDAVAIEVERIGELQRFAATQTAVAGNLRAPPGE